MANTDEEMRAQTCVNRLEETHKQLMVALEKLDYMLGPLEEKDGEPRSEPESAREEIDLLLGYVDGQSRIIVMRLAELSNFLK